MLSYIAALIAQSGSGGTGPLLLPSVPPPQPASSDPTNSEQWSTPDPDAFNRAFLLHESDVRRFVEAQTHNHADGADISQEVWPRAWVAFSSFRGRSNTRTWLFSIARRAVADFYRSDARTRLAVLDSVQVGSEVSEESVATTCDPVREMAEVREQVEHCLGCLKTTLPLEQQVAMLLCDINGLSDHQASSTMRIKLGRFKHLLGEARKTMDAFSGSACAVARKTGVQPDCPSPMHGQSPPPPAYSRPPHMPDEPRTSASQPNLDTLVALRDALVQQLGALFQLDPAGPSKTEPGPPLNSAPQCHN